MTPPGERRANAFNGQEFQAHVTNAIVDALKRTANDPEFSKIFWQRGYAELAEHAGNASSQWIGKKLMVWAATAMVGWLVIWLVRSGAIK